MEQTIKPGDRVLAQTYSHTIHNKGIKIHPWVETTFIHELPGNIDPRFICTNSRTKDEYHGSGKIVMQRFNNIKPFPTNPDPDTIDINGKEFYLVPKK